MPTIRVKLDNWKNNRGVLLGGFLLAVRDQVSSKVVLGPEVVIERGGFLAPDSGRVGNLLYWYPGTALLFTFPGRTETARKFLEAMPETAAYAELVDFKGLKRLTVAGTP